MDRIIQVFDPKTQTVRGFQGIQLKSTKGNLFRYNGCFVDGGPISLIIQVDEKAVIVAYEEGLDIIPAEGDYPKIKHIRRPRSDKGMPHKKRNKKS